MTWVCSPASLRIISDPSLKFVARPPQAADSGHQPGHHVLIPADPPNLGPRCCIISAEIDWSEFQLSLSCFCSPQELSCGAAPCAPILMLQRNKDVNVFLSMTKKFFQTRQTVLSSGSRVRKERISKNKTIKKID